MSDSQPELSADLSIARLTVKGSADEEVSDIVSTFDEELETLIEEVKELKKLDFDLVEEYQNSDNATTQVPDTRTFD